MTKSNLTESGYIGEELLGNTAKELSRKCLVVRQTVQDGDFTLPEALNTYKVSKEDYEKFVAKSALQEIQISFSSSTEQLEVVYTIEIMAEMFRNISGLQSHMLTPILKEFKSLSKEIRVHKSSPKKAARKERIR